MEDLFSFITQLSDHSWMVYNTTEDKLRSLIWIVIQLSTATAYFAIPYEYYFWSKALPFRFADILTALFIGFTIFCGSHHVVDVLIMPTAPWWAILSVNIPMAIFSIGTAIFLRYNREKIVIFLESIVDYYIRLGIIKKGD